MCTCILVWSAQGWAFIKDSIIGFSLSNKEELGTLDDKIGKSYFIKLMTW